MAGVGFPPGLLMLFLSTATTLWCT